LSCVDVVSLAHHTLIFGIIEGSVLITTITTHTTVVVTAVNELLLGERQEIASTDLKAGLHAAHGRKAPT
jgi:hypothetical protein